MKISSVFAFLLNIFSMAVGDNWPINNASYVNFISANEGDDIILRCAGRKESEPGLWKFKVCGIGLDKPICADIDSEGSDAFWETLRNNNSKLILKDLNASQSGFYRCRQHATDKIYIYYTIQLEILPKYTDSNKLPQFLDNLPRNITTRKNSQAVFQCKVLSKAPVEISWAWHGDESSMSMESIYYSGQFYKIIGNGQQGQVGETILAKFDIPRVVTSNAGRYLCIAINIWGYSTSSAYLHVIDDEHRSEHVSQFYILFLIPVGLASIPLFMWICYIICKNNHHDVIQCEEYIDLPIDILLK